LRAVVAEEMPLEHSVAVVEQMLLVQQIIMVFQVVPLVLLV
jgi:hypothetical protein